ncbi:RNA polymerase factor sigma-54 [Bacillus mesophilum]|uniref:RNA polymerase factor sigma-54 n=1 Tax=Bacillus mesophilum TaxID=1071718 RepID=A0A7V7UVG1_9BACI|nr:RNA polymerase factor sigma-54 [Bacillus mesophilum]KAB2332766.1 RNA polymerase factor sigma-54 [Bacillus mesophilum]
MDLKAGLWQQQTLKLAMTQELKQSIELLQFNSQELTAFLEEKALENPLMELNSNFVKTMDPRAQRIKKSKLKQNQDKEKWIEQLAVNVQQLDDYLIQQLPANLTELEKKIILHFIYSLDENGYLYNINLPQVAELYDADGETVREQLDLLQHLEPAGIGARSLQECLLLQLERLVPVNEMAEEIIRQHFQLFADKKWKQLAREIKADVKEIQAVYDLVQTLNPKPGASFASEKPAYIIPDVIVYTEQNGLHIQLYDENVPSISYNEGYAKKLHSAGDQQVGRYLQNRQQDYQWIKRSIEQRKETILKVTRKIAERQPQFFLKGSAFLKPMTMKEIADELEIHESTVSRAVRGKYMQTPFGTFELRSFFVSMIKTAGNADASSKEAKAAIHKLISSENKQKPLSDQEIANLLKTEAGFVISRRTAAKYREQLGIPSSSKRKRYD